MTGNAISKVPNEEPQLKLLRARTRIYALTSRIFVAQLVLTLLIPALGAFLVLDRRQKLLIKRAAKVGQNFDCAVLERPLGWFNAGDPREIQGIHAAARVYARCKDDTWLRDRYPVAAGQAPQHLARIFCQRMNLRYDSQLRRSYHRSQAFG